MQDASEDSAYHLFELVSVNFNREEGKICRPKLAK